MVSVKRNKQIVRASAGYDLVVTAGFMTPWTATWVFEGFAKMSDTLGLDRPIPTLDVTAMLLANLLGSVVVVWSLWRLRHASRIVGLYDALARGLFALWQLYAVTHGASFLLLGFTVFEVAFGIAQSWPVRENAALERTGAST
ncbi:hypothetical protein ACIQAL_14655 [Pseudomonas sp. NPDC088368]|uniref:hypothetical protein n=1 Tax=Pseudomonas sp. NPDC088368 TaxID=3364453 RepID=UPI00381630A1